MNVSSWVWAATLVGLVGLLSIDLFIVGRRPHEPSVRESATWVAVYVGLAALFGLGIGVFSGASPAGQFAAGWLTEYSLSVDNLFVFVIIMSRFGVARRNQQRVLLFGIALALVLRGAFIAAGSALIHQFVWVFYVFGGFLVVTAWRLARHGEDDESDFKENVLIRWSRQALPMTPGYHGSRLVTVINGKRLFTPLFVVMIALGTTDLLFALDSIPAIFGLTTEPYLVFTANVFALMGLRQLYFLLGGLLDRLTYLSVGLSVILGFIGVKLFLQALHANNVPFINGGEPIDAIPTVPIWLSLTIILVTLITTTVMSLITSRRQSQADEQLQPGQSQADERGVRQPVSGHAVPAGAVSAGHLDADEIDTIR